MTTNLRNRCSSAILCSLIALGAAVAATPAQRPIRVALNEAPDGIDPQLDSTSAGGSIHRNIFGSLVAIDAAGGIVPDLATKWERLGDTSWRFELRPGVRFHDGSPFSSADAVASLLRARELTDSVARVFLAGVKSVTAEGPLALRVVLAHPDAVFLVKVSTVYIVPAGSPAKITAPIGTGPYKVIPAGPGAWLELEAFDGYWGPKPREKRFTLIVEENEQAAIHRLLANDLDLITGLRPLRAREIEANDQFWIESSLGSIVSFLVLNANQPPLDNALIREAIDFTVDRPAIAKEVFLNYARPAGQTATSSATGYAKGIEPPVRDLPRAKALLKVAAPQGGVRFTLSFKRGGVEPFAELIAKQLAEVGIRVDLEPCEWTDLLPRIYAGHVQAAIYSWRTTPLDVGMSYDQLLHSKSASAPRIGLPLPELDRLIESSDVALDPAERLALLQSIAEKIAARRALVPLIWRMDLFGSRKTIKWMPVPSADVNFSTFSRQ